MNADGSRPAGEPRPPETLQREKLWKGIRLFAVLTVGGVGLLSLVTVDQETIEALRGLRLGFSLGFMALALACGVLDLLIGSWRYQIFLRRLDPRSPFSLPVRADLANRFTGAVTPSQTGGGPAQVFILWRGGVRIPDALSFLAINFMATLVFFLLAGGFTAFMLRRRVGEGLVAGLIRYGFVAFGIMTLFFVVVLFRPDLIARPCRALVERIDPGRGGWVGRIRWLRDGTVRSLDRYREACTLFIRKAPVLLVWSFLLTVLLYVNKFTVAYFVMRGLGVQGSYLEVLAIQALLQFILYVAPTPGGSGIAEVTTAALMALLIPRHLLVLFTFAFRFFLLYLPATVGAFVLMGALKPPTMRPPAVVSSARQAFQVLATVALLLVGPVGLARAQVVPDRTVAATPLSIEPLKPLRPMAMTRDPVRDLLRASREAADLGSRLEHDDEAKAAFLESEALARQAVALRPDDAEAHYLLAVALGLRIELEGARTKVKLAEEVLTEAERAIELDPGHAGAHHVLGRLHAGTMRTSRIVRFIAKQLLGGDKLGEASWQAAEDHFIAARDLDPDLIAPHLELGVLYLDTDRPEQARVELLRVLELPSTVEGDGEMIQRARRLLEELR